MTTTPPSSPTTPVTEDTVPPEVVAEIQKIPAAFADTFYIGTLPGFVRITFGEWIGDKNNYRYSYVMPLDDAEALGKALMAMISDERKRPKSE